MILYPAIDLKEGRVVRLLRGDMDQATTYGEHPADQARAFRAAGCGWLHVVDLDGAFAGTSRNQAAITQIIEAFDGDIQLGGGVRTLDAVEGWLGRGISRVILGTAALKDPDLVLQACAAHPGRIAVGIDARDGKVAVEGWAETSEIGVLELAGRFADAGVAAMIYTDIARDGALSGPNVEATAELARHVPVPVIASGGVSSLADLIALRDTGVIAGAISGRALYDGRLDLSAALAA
ncbi:MAG: 1-(5-phosphoribosyl)-5-[(5-phosphoribosylamino)methylideneamino]imidazole-4-carboxamide isomerase, partial [Alphaproteobacteria bacterium]|nr:1-(5-phosphoribosyl)-5-[(5-phosphoribosylamino)methylideneamino]imidazole-4-carboxamide isomerase [Alphaproteobacteria bacterium]